MGRSLAGCSPQQRSHSHRSSIMSVGKVRDRIARRIKQPVIWVKNNDHKDVTVMPALRLPRVRNG